MRTVPAALQEHLDQPVTTTCRLLKIILSNGDEHGLTTLDRDVEYQGVTYSAINGFDASVIASDASFSVDNSEGYALLSADIPGITLEMAQRGDLDDAAWEALLVNYMDLSMGHLILDSGDLGEVRVVNDTVYIPELISYAMRLRNTIGHVDSRTCRAIFGSAANSQTGCGVNAEALWVFGSVGASGISENRRVFKPASALSNPSNLIPGRLRWHSGPNFTSSGRLYHVENITSDGWIELFEPLAFDIEVGDNFSIRPDCDKFYTTCRDRWNNLVNFKGEPYIPVNDGNADQTPGAMV